MAELKHLRSQPAVLHGNQQEKLLFFQGADYISEIAAQRLFRCMQGSSQIIITG